MTAPHLRVARATNSLTEMLRFYHDGLGFEVVGRFEDQDGFDGVMLGSPSGTYHFEFTVESGVTAPPAPSQENLLVLYLPDIADHQAAVSAMKEVGYTPVRSHNPYWDKQGVTFEDADGYRVVLASTSWKS